VKTLDFEIRKASFFDLYKIVKMALFYHKDDPKSQDILSSPLKSFLYKLFGPVYVRLTLIGFKAVVDEKIAGYILIKKRGHSIHIWDLVVDSDFRGKGIGEGLMKFAEKSIENKCQYISLAVMEDNAPAMHLYEKLEYQNFLFSPICYHLEKAAESEKNRKLIELRAVSGNAAIRSRSKHFSNVLDAVIGPDKREIVQLLYPLPLKTLRKTQYFTISQQDAEVGYVSIKQRKDLASAFLIISPKVWNTDAETEAITKVVERVRLRSINHVEICIVQAYEKNLENTLKNMNYAIKRKTPRLALIKKLE
jgi:ribosomal protein S18 acetylase RimI-like enzyme